MGRRLEQGFDEMTMALGQSTSRREAVRIISATVAGGLLSVMGMRGAAATCRKLKAPCSRHAQCCSGYCKPSTKKCAPKPCKGIGVSCSGNLQCCTHFCNPQSGVCGCKEIGRACTEDRQCCSGRCDPNTGTCLESTACSPNSRCGSLEGCGPSGSNCKCLTSVEGVTTCTGSVACGDVPTCVTTLECTTRFGPGWICAPNTCCPQAKKCVPPCGSAASADPRVGLTTTGRF